MSNKPTPGCLLALALTTSGFLLLGCNYFPESTFRLASDSRLPKWVTLPRGVERQDVAITMSYYIRPGGNSASFTVRNGKRVIKQIDGKLVFTHPIVLSGSTADYPSYAAVVVNGTTELMEHKRMEPIFHVTDDPDVWKYYAAHGCG